MGNKVIRKVDLRLNCEQMEVRKRQCDNVYWCNMANGKCPYWFKFERDHRITPFGIEYCNYGINEYCKKEYFK